MNDLELALDLHQRRPGAAAPGLARGTARLLANMGYGTLDEVSLPNGRRADLMALNRRGQLVIVEIKSSLADFRADDKWRDYRDCCDAFYFAVGEEFPRDALPEDCGLIVADDFDAVLIREAPRHGVAAGLRRRLTLRFARIAAARLGAVMDAGR